MAKRAQSDTVQLNLRIKEIDRQKIEDAARDHGISMNSETALRLRMSFERDKSIQDIFGSPGLFEMMKIIASTMKRIGENKRPDLGGDLWLGDPDAYAAAMVGAMAVLSVLRPNAENIGNKPLDATVVQHLIDAKSQEIAEILEAGRTAAAEAGELVATAQREIERYQEMLRKP